LAAIEAFRIVYELCLTSGTPYSSAGNHLTASQNEATVTSASPPAASASPADSSRAVNRPQVSDILAALGQAAFVWDIASDAIAWTEQAAAIFGDIDAASLASGAAYAKLIEPSASITTSASEAFWAATYMGASGATKR